jgi:hypothetical protein
MAIEQNYVTAIQHSQDTSTAIEVVSVAPDLTTLSANVNPGRLLGYYNSSTDSVQLYVADANGLRWVPVQVYVPS